jgi:two-component system, cell cycle response regulator
MQLNVKKFFVSLWARPDPVLAGAGIAGELLVAKIRLALATLLLTLPVINTFTDPDPKEAFVGFSLTIGTFAFAAAAYFLVSHQYNPHWLSFVSSGFDVSLVSAALTIFLFVNEPHTAVNSKVVFEGYFLGIASASLRYDQRVCLTSGFLALSEYFAIVFYASHKWDLNSPAYAPYPYGMFSWGAQISRLILMLTAVALSIAVVARSQKLLRLATRDPLTGLFNRGYVDDRFAIELSRARRYGQPLTIAIIDVDRFKLLNDTHGHGAGDFVLRNIGATLRSTFRQSDTAGRYGGEEFVVIIPETDMATAEHKLESLRSFVEKTPLQLPSGQAVNLTISAGLASLPDDGTDAQDLFATADERLFQAKRAGRNRIVAAREAVPA